MIYRLIYDMIYKGLKERARTPKSTLMAFQIPSTGTCIYLCLYMILNPLSSIIRFFVCVHGVLVRKFKGEEKIKV